MIGHALDPFEKEVEEMKEISLASFKPNSGAEFSACRKYRYALWRIWDDTKPLVMFIGLNPSTANETEPDPTIKRVCAIAKNNGFGGIYMMNCFPFVTAYPNELQDFYTTPFHEIEDEKNMQYLISVAYKCQTIVFAWGNFKVVKERAKTLANIFPNAKALHINKNGSPKHPLFCRADSKFIDFKY